MATVTLEFENLTARVRINRAAELNALNSQVLRELRQVFAQLREMSQGPQAFSQARVVLLESEGAKAFVAGADIKEMQQASSQQLSEFIALGQDLNNEIEATPLPVLAIVQGVAIGGGLELALACDFIVASTNAKLGLAETNLGLIPGFGGTQRLQLRCGPAVTRRLVYTGETISAEEAQRLGVVDYVFAPEELSSGAAKIAQALLQKSPVSLAAAKRSILAFQSSSLGVGLKFEREEFLQVFSSKDAAEGVLAFVEKRKPQFQGR